MTTPDGGIQCFFGGFGAVVGLLDAVGDGVPVTVLVTVVRTAPSGALLEPAASACIGTQATVPTSSPAAAVTAASVHRPACTVHPIRFRDLRGDLTRVPWFQGRLDRCPSLIHSI